MKIAAFLLMVAIGLAIAPSEASATLTNCSLTAPTISPAYVDTAPDNRTPVTFTVICNRSGAPNKNDIRISLNQIAAETMPNISGVYPDTLRYNFYTDVNYSLLWTTGAASTTGAGSIEIPIDFTAQANSLSTTFTAYMAIPTAQAGKGAGTYLDTLSATIYDVTSNKTTPMIGTGTFSAGASIAKNCNFSATLPAWSLTYTAFQASTITDASQNLVINCTRGTFYTLALDATAGIVPTVELAYTLRFTSNSSASVTNTTSTTGANVPHNLTLTIPANQPGSCTTGTCTGNSIRTITVSY
jgi:hypothetical protein